MNTGLIAAFGTLLCWTAGTFAFTAASRQAEAGAMNRVRLLHATLLLSLVVVLLYGLAPMELITLPTPYEWFWLGLSGIIGLTIGDFFAFNAYRILGSSRTSLFSAFAPVAALLLGILMLGETINLAGIMGMMISICGILWFIRSTRRTTDESVDRKRISSGILFAIIGAVTQGLGLVCSKKGLNIIHLQGPDLSPVHASWIRIIVAMLAAYSLAVFKRNILAELKTMSTTMVIARPLLIGTLFGPVLGVSLSLVAATQLQVGVAQTIFSLQPLTVMLAATISGKERLNASSVIAALVCVLGVFVLVWRDEISTFIF